MEVNSELNRTKITLIVNTKTKRIAVAMPFIVFIFSVSIPSPPTLNRGKYPENGILGRHNCISYTALAASDYTPSANSTVADVFWFTRSRSSFPGLKCGTYLPLNATGVPVFGFLPILGTL